MPPIPTPTARRRAVVLAVGTIAVATLSSVAPVPRIEAVPVVGSAPVVSTLAFTGSTVPTTATTATSTTAAPVARRAPARAARPAAIPYRFGTAAYAQWWARNIMKRRYGWTSTTQFQCLVKLWNRESHWNYRAHNRSSGAHGIPQALPGSRMAKIGADWRTNPVTQIRWGLGYIKGRYGTPCGAWRHFQSRNWY